MRLVFQNAANLFVRPDISITDALKAEGNTLLFEITASHSVGVPTNFSIAYTDQETNATDYSGPNSIILNGSDTTTNISVIAIDDTTIEPVENFLLTLSTSDPVNFLDVQARGTIFDNDSAATPEPWVCDGRLFQTLDYRGEMMLYEIDTSNGNMIPLANLSDNGVINTINAIGYNAIDNYIYGIAQRAPFALYRIDANGRVQNLGNITGLGAFNNAGAIDVNGNYYVTGVSQQLYQIDISTRTASIIGNMGVATADIAVNPENGNIYGWSAATKQLISIDASDASVTLVGSPNPRYNLFGSFYYDRSNGIIAYGDDTTIPGGQQTTLVTIDQDTGVVSNIATGPATGNNDGCSCVFGIEFNKEAVDAIDVCATDSITYTYTIVNATGINLTDINLQETLTDGLTYASEPFDTTAGISFSGTLTGQTSSNLIMSVPIGESSFKISVRVPRNYMGPATYSNLTYIDNISSNSSGLVDRLDSNDPNTAAITDQTAVEIRMNDYNGDNLPDCFDLDDDNDGVPDTSEGCGTSTDLSGTIGVGNQVSDGSSYDLGFASLGYTLTNPSSAAVQVNDIGANGDAITFIGDATTTTGELTATFSRPVSNVSFKLTDFDGLEEMFVNVYDENNTLYDLTVGNNVIVGSEIEQTGNEFIHSGAVVGVDGNDPASDSTSSLLFNFPGTVNRIVVAFRALNNNRINFTEPEFCSLDTDNDGVFDYRDLDSDNDGIYDAVEAGHGQTHSNGALTGPAGSDGIPDSVQNSPNDENINYGISDSDTDGNFDLWELDSDNDACLDVVEAGFTDTDTDGYLGNGLVVVDNNGHVTSGVDGYTVPADENGNSTFDFQEAGMANTITEQPDDCVVCELASTSFSVTATGVNSYQWQIDTGSGFNDLTDGGIYSGSTTDVLTLTGVRSSDSGGRYRVLTGNGAYSCGQLASESATLTVTSYPDITIDDAEVVEGGTIVFPVNLSTESCLDQDITLTFSMTNGTADETDYLNTPVQITILAGSTSANVSVPTFADDLIEANETFTIAITSVDTGTVMDISDTAVGTIVNEDFVDIDSDDDGILDSFEDLNLDGDNDPATDPTDSDGDQYPDYLDIDSDNDGLPDNVEAQTTAGYIPPSLLDANDNGLDDAYEDDMRMGLIPVNTDEEDFPDYLDPDSDNDNIPDNIEGHDADHNGVADVSLIGSDKDDDGLDDGYEGAVQIDSDVNDEIDDPTNHLPNTDGDGELDFRDVDDDNDGIPTREEDGNSDGIYVNDDIDFDGTPDYLEANFPEVEVFNVVTPNDDGVHDHLIISGLDIRPNNHIRIFNRWGVLVYETKSYDSSGNRFNGTSQARATMGKEEKLPVGTYFYVLHYEDVEGQYRTLSGHLYLN